VEAARRVTWSPPGPSRPMCSSGGVHQFRPLRAAPSRPSRVWFKPVPAYGGSRRSTATSARPSRPRTTPQQGLPGEFPVRGGHVIQDLIDGRRVPPRRRSHAPTATQSTGGKRSDPAHTAPGDASANPRNGYQNYNCSVNLSGRTVYTSWGPSSRAGNRQLRSAGQLSPLSTTPATGRSASARAFSWAAGRVRVWHGTQHNPAARAPPRWCRCGGRDPVGHGRHENR